ncbi:MAG: hypothetical protein ACRDRZ_16790 [Pseudonocardiaceae bacterium]
MSMPNFAQSNQGLAAMQQHQQGLQAAVDAGQLWMEPDVAERAAQRCEQQVVEVDEIINDVRPLGRKRKFGDNADGEAAAEVFRNAAVEGSDSVTGVLTNSQEVLRSMAATYRAAGRAAAQAEQTNRQMFRGGSP